MADIFLSYSRKDLESVRPLAKLLEQQRWTVFWDRRLEPGGKWPDVLEVELHRSTLIGAKGGRERDSEEQPHSRAARRYRVRVRVRRLAHDGSHGLGRDTGGGGVREARPAPSLSCRAPIALSCAASRLDPVYEVELRQRHLAQ